MANITKLDAARRQWLAAVHLRWYFREPLAVYTLASNCWEICNALLEKSDKLRLLTELVRTSGGSMRDMKELINRPRNFVKHADRDPEASEPDIDGTDCDAILQLACVDYMMAAGRSPAIMGLYCCWYSAVYPGKTGGFFRPGADLYFPDLVNKSPSEQIAAARRVASAPLSNQVLNDLRNEMTDGSRWEPLRRLGANLPIVPV